MMINSVHAVWTLNTGKVAYGSICFTAGSEPEDNDIIINNVSLAGLCSQTEVDR